MVNIFCSLIFAPFHLQKCLRTSQVIFWNSRPLLILSMLNFTNKERSEPKKNWQLFLDLIKKQLIYIGKKRDGPLIPGPLSNHLSISQWVLTVFFIIIIGPYQQHFFLGGFWSQAKLLTARHLVGKLFVFILTVDHRYKYVGANDFKNFIAMIFRSWELNQNGKGFLVYVNL